MSDINIFMQGPIDQLENELFEELNFSNRNDISIMPVSIDIKGQIHIFKSKQGKIVENYLVPIWDSVKSRICEQFNYCNNKDSNFLQMIDALIDLLVALHPSLGALGLVVKKLATYLFRTMLDIVCDCKL